MLRYFDLLLVALWDRLSGVTHVFTCSPVLLSNRQNPGEFQGRGTRVSAGVGRPRCRRLIFITLVSLIVFWVSGVVAQREQACTSARVTLGFSDTVLENNSSTFLNRIGLWRVTSLQVVGSQLPEGTFIQNQSGPDSRQHCSLWKVKTCVGFY